MDLSKLSPAPWKSVRLQCQDDSKMYTHEIEMPERGSTGLLTAGDAEFITLARNAFDVMLRRKWGLSYRGGFEPGWFVLDILDDPFFPPGDEPALLPADPFTALVEADHWYTENVERTRPE